VRIKIEHAQGREGFPFKRPFHEVQVTVDFSHEERSIIQVRRLEDYVLMERWPATALETDDPDWYALRIQDLIHRKPDRTRWRTPAEAKVYTLDLSDALYGLKHWLEENAEPGQAQVMEL